MPAFKEPPLQLSCPDLYRTRRFRHGIRLLAAVVILNLHACDHSSSGASSSSASSGADAGSAAAPALLVTTVESVNAVVNGGAVSAALAFNSSGSTPITNLKVTAGLSAMPAGWSGPASFACASVATGNGCILNLTFAPTATAKGTVTIKYTYSEGGSAKSGAAAINYVATTNDNVVATPSPAGQVVALIGGGSQSQSVIFTTDDGNVATALNVTTNLTTLPAGWSSAVHTFSCASVSTGSGCELRLNFTPAAVGSGTLTLEYSYLDDFGTGKTGVVHIPYASTVHNNVVGTAAPAVISSAVGSGALSVPVTFTTDDGEPAGSLVLTTNLSALPAGWTSTAASFSCAEIAAGSPCQLPLSFTAAIGAIGTLQLGYSYLDNAGSPKTGNVNIPYASTTHDNVVGAIALGGTPLAGTLRAAVGSSAMVTVTFDTDDGNIASSFAVTSGLTSLPSFWSGPSSLLCAAISTGTSCQLSLTFAPQASTSGTVSLGFAYTDSAGTAKSGTVSVPYAVKHVYATDANGVYVCSIVTGGTLTGCTATAQGRVNSTGGAQVSAYGIAFAGETGYVNQYPDGSLAVCAVNPSDGTLSGCATTAFPNPADYAYSIYASSQNLYLGNAGANVCPIGATGALGTCATVTNSVTEYAFGMFVGSASAYVAQESADVLRCSVAGDGNLTPCADTGIATDGDGALTVAGGLVFLTPWGGSVIMACPINGNGTLSACTSSAVPGAGGGTSVATAVDSVNVYTITASDVEHCLLDPSTGLLSACAVSDGGATFSGPSGVAIF